MGIFKKSDDKAAVDTPAARRQSRAPRIDPVAERKAQQKRQTRNKVVGLVSVPIPIIAGLAYLATVLANQPEPDRITYCYEDLEQRHIPIFIGYETVGFARDHHLRDLEDAVMRSYKNPSTAPNTRLAIFTTSKQTGGDLADPVLEICKPATTVAEHKELQALDPNIPDLSLVEIKTNAKGAEIRFERKLNELLDDSVDKTKGTSSNSWNSPLLAQFRAISAYYHELDATVDDFLIFSTGIEVSPDAHWCKVQNDLPTYPNWKKRPLYNKLKPFDSFAGADVKFLLLEILDQFPQGDWCTANEIASFWKQYWSDHTGNGAIIHPLQYRPEGFTQQVGAIGLNEAAVAMLFGLYGGFKRSGEG